jgi:DNA-binding response OmpR family regulator
MRNDQITCAACQVFVLPATDSERPSSRRRYGMDPNLAVDGPWSYRAKRGRGTVRLNLVEYRILELLASRPNQVFSPCQIADAVSTTSRPVTAESLRGHVASLRRQLGFFNDYVQAVPFMGYRFKA